MLLLVAYDINTSTKEGQKRLQKISKECGKYGQRVQNSLFECYIDYSKCIELRNKLEKIIDTECDSIRLYFIGNNYDNKIFCLGKDNLINIDKPIIF